MTAGEVAPRLAGARGGRAPSAAHRVRALIALALCTGVSCRRGSPGDAAAEAAAANVVTLGPENIAIVARGLVRSGPVVSGTLAPVRDAQIRAQVGGSILAVEAQQGQRVASGQVLARIDAAGLRDAYLSARSTAGSAQTAADYAARQAQRYDTLAAAGAVSDRDRETVMQANAQAQAALSDAKARLVAAEKELAYTEVRAPFSGVIAERDVSAGDVVQPGTPLYSVVDPSALQLQASVPAEQIGSIRVGQPVVFTLTGYGDRSFAGHVTRINPVADPSTRQVELYASIPNPGSALVAGLFATGRVVTDSASGLVAPAAAIDTRNLRPAVERLRGGRVERVDVALGLRDAQTDLVQLVSGVAAGDTLLRGAAQGIAAGTTVRVGSALDTATVER